MKNHRTTSKLTVNRQTIRQLGTMDMSSVEGGWAAARQYSVGDTGDDCNDPTPPPLRK